MGIYINPTDMTKELFLAMHGLEIRKTVVSWPPKADHVLVCMVNNGPFRAAGVANSQEEMQVFLRDDPGDYRPKRWFVVPAEMVLPTVGGYAEQLKQDVAEYSKATT